MKLNEIKKIQSHFFTTREETEAWLKEMKIENYIINDDLTVDVNGDVDVSDKNAKFTTIKTDVKKFKHFPVKFGEVRGNFICKNTRLTSLIGAPRKVGGNFNCGSCDSLKSLDGAPDDVGGDFYAGYCDKLASLKGAPQKVGGDFSCYDCPRLTSLEGAPRKVGGNFECSRCYNITSFNGAPDEIGHKFSCVHCVNEFSYLGLLKIKKLKSIECSNYTVGNIINKHLPEGNIFQCQIELLDAGLNEYAEL